MIILLTAIHPLHSIPNAHTQIQELRHDCMEQAHMFQTHYAIFNTASRLTTRLEEEYSQTVMTDFNSNNRAAILHATSLEGPQTVAP